MKDDPLPKLLAFIMLATIVTCSNMEQVRSKMEPTVAEHVTVQDSAIIAQSPHFYEEHSILAMVDCLSWEETKDDPNAINWDDWHKRLDGTWKQGSFGCLQFSEDTFSEYCITKYGLAEEMTYTILMNCSIQRECAINMLEENKGHRWSTYKYCN